MIKRLSWVTGLGVLLCSVPASAVEEIYRTVFFDAEVYFEPDFHREEVFTGDEITAVDLDADTLEFRAFEENSIGRTMNLLDPSAAGSGVSFETDAGTDDCDEGGLPCPEAITENNGYIVAGEALSSARGVFSPGNEFFVAVNAESERLALARQGSTSMSLLIDRPSSLTLASMSGEYQFFRYNASLIEFTGGGTEETFAIDDIDITFNGNGTCSGSVALREGFHTTGWTDTTQRRDVTIAREPALVFNDCDYTVDSAAGTVTLDVAILDDGEIDAVAFDLFVSSSGRYVIGRDASTEIDGNETENDAAYWVGVRKTTMTTNAAMQGVYLMSTWGQMLSNNAMAGIDTDFVERAAVELSGGAADGSGYSACSLISHQRAGLTRELYGLVPNTTAAYDYTDDIGLPQYAQCRYRVSGNELELGLSADGVGFDSRTFAISDDLNTLTNGDVGTSQATFPANTDIPVTAPGYANATITVGQKINESANGANVADFGSSIVPQKSGEILLTASVLPLSRSVQVGTTATAFASLINLGSQDGLGCDLVPSADFDGQFFYQPTDPATNATNGPQNQPVDIPAGATQTFLFGITPQSVLDPTDFGLDFECANANTAGSFVGLNTLLLSASNTPVADIVALGATATNDGIVHLDAGTMAGAFSVATVNVGATSNLTVAVDTGGAVLPVATSICQTNPGTGACINPTTPGASVNVTVAGNETPTFAVFVAASESVALDPAGKRIFVRFEDGGGEVRGATSVAVQSD